MSPPQMTTTSGRRASRPAPLNRKSTTCPASKKSPVGKTSPGWIKSTGKTTTAAESDDDMSALPSFCGLCEKQLTSPGQILYCSEACRRRDNKPLAQSLSSTDLSAQPTPQKGPAQFGEYSIIPMKSPTIMRPLSHASDSSEDSPYYTRHDSEAARYLSQYSKQSDDRASNSNYSIPSLSHTPSSLASASGGSYMSTRLFPRRSDPYSASFSSFSIDLITPVNPEQVQEPSSLGSRGSTSTMLNYEKKLVGNSPSRSSLKQLFSHEAMKAPPKHGKTEHE
ncbi:hypothetical protein MBLNU459_g7512t1 [Dothideomycetes sp. NU459]